MTAYRRDMTQFLQFAGRAGVNDPAQVEPLLLRRFLALQRTRGLAAASIARKAAALRTGFRFLARRGLVPDNPAAGLGVPRGPKRLPVVLKPRQVDRLLAGPDPVDPVGLRDRAVLELLYATGIRVGELCGLGLGDVDLAADTVLVLGKGAKQRIVPFGEPARAALLDYLVNGRVAMLPGTDRPATSTAASKRDATADREALFFNRRGRPMTQRDVAGNARAISRGGRRARWDQPAHPAPQLCDPPAGRRCRSPGGAGIAGARCPDHDPDLHSRFERAAPPRLRAGASARLSRRGEPGRRPSRHGESGNKRRNDHCGHARPKGGLLGRAVVRGTAVGGIQAQGVR